MIIWTISCFNFGTWFTGVMQAILVHYSTNHPVGIYYRIVVTERALSNEFPPPHMSRRISCRFSEMWGGGGAVILLASGSIQQTMVCYPLYCELLLLKSSRMWMGSELSFLKPQVLHVRWNIGMTCRNWGWSKIPSLILKYTCPWKVQSSYFS